MEELKSRGDIQHWGVSITTAEEGIAASDCTDCEVIQLYANIAEPDLLNVLLPSIDSSRIGIMVRMPLGSGLLTGKYTVDHEFIDNDYRLTRDQSWRQRMIEFCNRELGHKPLKERVHIALEYILNYGKVSTVTCGMRSSHQVQDNVSALYL
jgi:aryl-alcohol dehydrogenase-like predicted oxidoreductase